MHLGTRLALHPWRALAAALALTTALAAGLPRLTLDVSQESYFAKDDPALTGYEDLLRAFGSDEVVYVLVDLGAGPGDVFEAPHLDRLLELGRALARTPHALDVRSPLHTRIVTDEDGALVSRSVVEAPPTTPAGRAAARARVLGHVPFQDLLVSRDARRVGFLVRIAPEARTSAGRAQVCDAVDAVLASGEWTDYARAAVGTPQRTTRFSRLIVREIKVVLALGLAAVVLVLALLFRSARAVLVALSVVLTTIVATFGLAGLASVPLSILSGSLLTLFICVVVADVMHVLSAFQRFGQRGLASPEALATALDESWLPCLLTSVTTAVGFLSLLGSPVEPIGNVGLMGAAGCTLAFALMLGLLPAFLVGAPPPPAASTTDLSAAADRGLERVQSLVVRRPRATLVGCLLLFAALAAGIPRIVVDQHFLHLLAPDDPLRRELEFVQERMGGAVGAEVVIDTGRPEGALAASVLRETAAFEAWLRGAHPAVRAVRGIPDALEEVHAVWGGPREVPATDDAAAQLLLVLSSADAELHDQHVSRDGRALRVSVRLDTLGSRDYEDLLSRMRAELDRRFSGVATCHLTGGAVLIERTKAYLLSTQVQSFLVSLALVSTIICVGAGQLRLGLISLVPNVVPVLGVLGAMGWLGIAVEVNTVMIAAVTLGIVVDDTVHFVWHYRAASRTAKDDAEALRATMERVGRPVLFTTLVLVLCFVTHLPSGVSSVRDTGVLAILTFVSALAAEVVLVPALLMTWPLRRAAQERA